MNYILSIILLFVPLIGHAQTAVSGAKADEMMQKVGSSPENEEFAVLVHPNEDTENA